MPPSYSYSEQSVAKSFFCSDLLAFEPFILTFCFLVLKGPFCKWTLCWMRKLFYRAIPALPKEMILPRLFYGTKTPSRIQFTGKLTFFLLAKSIPRWNKQLCLALFWLVEFSNFNLFVCPLRGSYNRRKERRRITDPWELVRNSMQNEREQKEKQHWKGIIKRNFFNETFRGTFR